MEDCYSEGGGFERVLGTLPPGNAMPAGVREQFMRRELVFVPVCV